MNRPRPIKFHHGSHSHAKSELPQTPYLWVFQMGLARIDEAEED